MTRLPSTGELSGRAIPEWIGATPDTPVPDRVVLRIILRQNHKDAVTGLPIRPGFIVDHRTPLADGGENRERNLQIINGDTSAVKTAVEATSRAKVRLIAKKHLGIGRTRNPIPGSRGTPFKKKFSGEVVRRDGKSS